MRVAGVVGVIGVIGVLGVVGVVGGRRRTPNHSAIDVKSSGYSGFFFVLQVKGAGVMSSQWQEGKEGKGER